MKKILLLIFLLSFCLHIMAQNREITGLVVASSDKMPLPGVNVLIKNTTTGTATNATGEFTITSSAKAVTLVFSFIGYVTKEIVVPENESFIKVELVEDVAALSEVVVTGYGTSSKREVTGAAYSISGRAAGVKIRGVSSSKVSGKTSKSDIREADIAVYESSNAGAGILTAGEIHDFSKWKLWEDISKNDLPEWQKYWQIKPLQRYTVQLVSEEGFPVVDVPVMLKDESGQVLWQTKSDNTGKGELWRDMFATAQTQTLFITASVDGKTYQIDKPTAFHQGINIIKVNRSCSIPSIVDIAFVVDATGSMGDEINYLQAELNDVISKVKDSLQQTTINLGSVFYRDEGDEYVTRTSALSTDIHTTIDFIKNQRAGGGGDIPEAVDQALETALEQLHWSKNAKARLLFLILDAPPHYNKQVLNSIHALMSKAAAKGVRIIPIAASGIDKSTEYLMRAFALATNGTYLFLTDDSGVGNPHIKPTTDKYEVELLNALLIKVIVKFTQVNTCEQAAQAYSSRADNTITDQAKSDVKTDNNQNTSYPWKYYPNPTKDIIHIEAGKAAREIFITDVSGKIIIRKEWQGKSTEINMLNYPNGIYFIKLYTDGKWESAKFIVSR